MCFLFFNFIIPMLAHYVFSNRKVTLVNAFCKHACARWACMSFFVFLLIEKNHFSKGYLQAREHEVSSHAFFTLYFLFLCLLIVFFPNKKSYFSKGHLQARAHEVKSHTLFYSLILLFLCLLIVFFK